MISPTTLHIIGAAGQTLHFDYQCESYEFDVLIHGWFHDLSWIRRARAARALYLPAAQIVL